MFNRSTTLNTDSSSPTTPDKSAPGNAGVSALTPSSDASECERCAKWLPPNGHYRPRVVSCVHVGDNSLTLFRHFDIPDYVCLARRGPATGNPLPDLFTQYEDGVMAFAEADALLRGDA